ncbi:MAG: hypothetical protein QGG42_21615 [Phycisphaerae bacterium]|jgi:hypothetical protein|nr:hypothetical protein [Phycisphaerae bacterium]
MVLLEVVLATALFATTALVILGGLHACFRSLGKMQLESQAADLALSKASEVHIGLVAPEDDGPNEYEEDEELIDWTWEIVTEEVEVDMEQTEAPPLLQVQVIITNIPSGYTYTTRFLIPEPPEVEEEEDSEELAGGPAP